MSSDWLTNKRNIYFILQPLVDQSLSHLGLQNPMLQINHITLVKELQSLLKANQLNDYRRDLSILGSSYEEAAKGGLPEGQYHFARHLQNLGDQKSLMTSAAFFSLASQQNILSAETSLALCFYHGWGVAQNETKTYELLFSASQKGDKRAQFCWSQLLLKKSKNRESRIEAFQWLKQAATGEHPYPMAVQVMKGYQSQARVKATQVPFLKGQAATQVLRQFPSPNRESGPSKGRPKTCEGVESKVLHLLRSKL